jgi:hypothetical protein
MAELNHFTGLLSPKWKKMCESRLFIKKKLLFDLVNEVTISFRSCHRILTTDWNMQDIPRFVPCLLTDYHNHGSVHVTALRDSQFPSQIITEEKIL